MDEKANTAQRDALVKLAKQQGGDLVKNVIKVESAPITIDACHVQGERLRQAERRHRQGRDALPGRPHDKKCGNEYAYYPPLAKNVKAQAAVAVEHGYSGKGLKHTWKESERRGAYVGTFEIK